MKILHGADYNPDQWQDYPDILEKDIELMKKSKCNAVSINIFGWSLLEPEEGVFNFEWLDNAFNRLSKENIKILLSTPSGARPAWMAKKYLEVLRVKNTNQRIHFADRQNHCYSSPIYQEKIKIINEQLALRYKDNPSLYMWHLSNEFGEQDDGDCHCPLCQENFRRFLQRKYDNDLDKLNHSWWANFWGRKYTDWEQIESPLLLGHSSFHGQNLDWKRFTTYQLMEYIKAEQEPLRRITPNIPIFTNFCHFTKYDNTELATLFDLIAWDTYPAWHITNGFANSDPEGRDYRLASDHSFIYSMQRNFLDKPYLQVECTPSGAQWQPVMKLKRPNMNALSNIQSIAHGSNSAMYFQFRKSRGASEKFHGAIVDHVGHENTRVFKEVTALGEDLSYLDEVYNEKVNAEVAIIYDVHNFWALKDNQGPHRTEEGIDYIKTIQDHYFPLWKKGINCDVISSTKDFSKYKLLIAPMLYMYRDGVKDRIESFVANGGIFISTYWSGIANEQDLCFLDGFPGSGMQDIVGIWEEELEGIYPKETKKISIKSGYFSEKIEGIYEVSHICGISHPKGAEILGVYEEDFYKGYPVLSVNSYKQGTAYYLASRFDEKLMSKFYDEIINKHSVRRIIDLDFPDPVTVNSRNNNKGEDILFFQNYSSKEQTINLKNYKLLNIISKKQEEGFITIKPYGYVIVK